jgi:hypothetical protein
VKELHGTNSKPDVFDNPNAVFQRCCTMMKHAYDPLGKKGVLGAFSVVGVVGNYTLPQKSATTPPAPATTAHEPRGRKNTAGNKRSKEADPRSSKRGHPRNLKLRPDGSGAGRTRTFADEKQRCKVGTCRFDHGERLCYADPLQRIQLSFAMKPVTLKKIKGQREENAQWLRCKVKPIMQGAPRQAAMAVSEDGVNKNGVDMTQWAFFAQAEGAPRDYAQARPSTGIDDPGSEPETESGSDGEGAAPGVEFDRMRSKLAQVQARL